MRGGFRFGIQVWLLLLSFVSAAPIALFSAYAVFQFALNQRQAVTDDLAEHARIAAGSIGLRLNGLVATLNALATSDAASKGDFRALHAHARRMIDLQPEATAIVLIGPDATVLFNTNIDWGEPTPPLPARASAITAITTGKPAVSPLFLAPVRKIPVVSINVPMGVEGRPTHVLRMTIAARVFENVMAEQEIPAAWTMVVTDQAGTIIARNHDASRYVGSPTVASVRDAVARGDGLPFLSVTHDGTEVRAIATPIQSWNWSLVVGAPTDVLGASLRHSLIALGLGAAVSCGIGAAFVVWLFRHLTGEVSAASRASQAVGEGHLPIMASSTIRELDAIGDALGNAAEREERVTTELTALAESERRLAEANRDLARSNAELEQFAYVASHDLREPLRMISAYLDLINRRYQSSFDADGLEFIAFARDGARRMDEMVMNLLEFSRIGRRGAPFETMALAEVVTAALSNLAVAIGESGAAVEVADNLPTVTGSRPELVRLIQNLIANALKFRSPERTPLIRLSITPGDKAWTVSISDNGIGIAPEHFDRIFQIFQRLHTREKYEGTGIGLAICRKIVERHGGHIWVESVPGEGSTFSFTLPNNSVTVH